MTTYPADLTWEDDEGKPVAARIHRGRSLPYMDVLRDYRAHYPAAVAVMVEEVDMVEETDDSGRPRWAEVILDEDDPTYHFTIASRAAE